MAAKEAEKMADWPKLSAARLVVVFNDASSYFLSVASYLKNVDTYQNYGHGMSWTHGHVPFSLVAFLVKIFDSFIIHERINGMAASFIFSLVHGNPELCPPGGDQKGKCGIRCDTSHGHGDKLATALVIQDAGHERDLEKGRNNVENKCRKCEKYSSRSSIDGLG